MNFTVLHFDILESTNNEAAAHARWGAVEGLCIVADEQTAGRGRQGRQWISEKGAGVLMSLVLRPKLVPEHITLIPLMAGAAVYDVLLKRFRVEPDIKWPNDILIGEKKISGILTETVDTTQGLAIILGIGINIKGIGAVGNATSIEDESAVPAVRDEIVDSVNGEIDQLYGLLHSDPSAIISEWARRSSYFSGKAVEVRSGGDFFQGVTCGIEGNGALRVRTAEGIVRVVHAGDVESVRSGN